jgi:hypothetical protein
MADGDDPFAAMEALLGGGEGEVEEAAEESSDSDVGSEDDAAVDADDPFASMAALLVSSVDSRSHSPSQFAPLLRVESLESPAYAGRGC